MCEEQNGYPVSGLDRIPPLDVFEVARYPVSIRCIPNIVHQKEMYWLTTLTSKMLSLTSKMLHLISKILSLTSKTLLSITNNRM